MKFPILPKAAVKADIICCIDLGKIIDRHGCRAGEPRLVGFLGLGEIVQGVGIGLEPDCLDTHNVLRHFFLT